jgi:hypothetical protein
MTDKKYNFLEKIKNISLNKICEIDNPNEKKKALEHYNIIINIIKELYDNQYKYYYNKLSDIEKKIIDESKLIEFTNFNNLLLNKDIEFVINIRVYNIEKNNIKFNWKYKISSVYLYHDFEIFHNKMQEPFALVSNFHLSCVRAYYTMENKKPNIYLLPSCLISLLTFNNSNINYFHGKTNKFEIINKYRMRGFGTIVNSSMYKGIREYIRNNKFWNNLLPILNNLNFPLYIKDELFKPRLRNMDTYYNSKYQFDNENLYK